MNRRTALSLFAALAFGAAAASPASATPSVGAPAPAFSATDSSGSPVSLAAYRGKTVVLEWTNHQCPYVVKHYGSDNMQALQKEATGDGIVWLQILSSAPGLGGHLGGKEAVAKNAERGAEPSRVLLDPDGKVGRAYAARHTPTMAVIDPKGTLAYYGAIDSDSNWHPSSVEGATNYVRAALSDLKAGRDVQVAKTRGYGCSIKYAD